LRFSEGEFNL